MAFSYYKFERNVISPLDLPLAFQRRQTFASKENERMDEKWKGIKGFRGRTGETSLAVKALNQNKIEFSLVWFLLRLVFVERTLRLKLSYFSLFLVMQKKSTVSILIHRNYFYDFVYFKLRHTKINFYCCLISGADWAAKNIFFELLLP